MTDASHRPVDDRCAPGHRTTLSGLRRLFRRIEAHHRQRITIRAHIQTEQQHHQHQLQIHRLKSLLSRLDSAQRKTHGNDVDPIRIERARARASERESVREREREIETYFVQVLGTREVIGTAL